MPSTTTTGYVGEFTPGPRIRVGDRVNFGYPQLGFAEVVAIEAGGRPNREGTVCRLAVLGDGSKRALFAQDSYAVDTRPDADEREVPPSEPDDEYPREEVER